MQLPERVQTVILYAPIPLFMVVFRPETAWIIFTLLACVGMFEFRRMLYPQNDRLYTLDTRVSVLGMLAVMIVALFSYAWAMVVVGVVTFFVVSRVKDHSKFDTGLMQVLIPVAAVLVYALRSSDISSSWGSGLALFGLAFVVATFSDTAAYFVGRWIGAHKLAPQISPNKTWEGAIGGWIFALIGGSLYSTFFLPGLAAWSFWMQWLVYLFLAVVGQVGDLAESALKRKYKVKDSGDIFPGHGGVLDRFDSWVPILVSISLLSFFFG